MTFAWAMSLLLTTVACVSVADSCVLDLQDWQAGTDLAEGWNQSGLMKYASGVFKGAAYFNGADDCLISPVFPEPISTVVIEGGTLSKSLTRTLYLIPSVQGAYGEAVALANPSYGAISSQTVSMKGLGATRFRLVSVAGQGNWAIRRVTVFMGEQGDTPDEPPTTPQACCWTLSRLSSQDGPCAIDFSELHSVTKKTPWKNGESGDGFYAFTDFGGCTNIGHATASSRTYGLYAQTTNDTPVLAMLGTSGSSMRMMLPVCCDTTERLERLTLTYQARCLTEANPTVMSLSWARLEDLSKMVDASTVWICLENGTFSSEQGVASFVIDMPARSLKGLQYICFRWSVPQQSRSSMLGIADVTLEAATASRGSLFFLR